MLEKRQILNGVVQAVLRYGENEQKQGWNHNIGIGTGFKYYFDNKTA